MEYKPPKLPMNAQAFFSKNKPSRYIYGSRGDAQRGVVTGRAVGVIGDKQGKPEDMGNKPAHLVAPHLQPKIVTPQPAPIIGEPKPTQAQKTAIKIKPVYGQVGIQPARPMQATVKQQSPRNICKYSVRGYNSGCGCTSLVCNNPECPLSTPIPPHGKVKLHGNSCTPENCRWFTPNK